MGHPFISPFVAVSLRPPVKGFLKEVERIMELALWGELLGEHKGQGDDLAAFSFPASITQGLW